MLKPKYPGKLVIDINDGEKTLEVDEFGTLLGTLGSNESFFLLLVVAVVRVFNVFVVNEGGGEIRPQKPSLLAKGNCTNHRLGCQVKVKENMKIHIKEILGLRNGKQK